MSRWALWIVLSLGCARAEPPSPVVEARMPECVVRFEVGKAGSVLEEQRAAGPAAYDFFATYPAARIDPSTQRPVATVAARTGAGRPMLWFTADFAGVVVDDAVLSDLTVADVTRMGAGETATVGRLTEAGRALPGREVALFLIEARAVATWVHIGATLCLAEEQTGATGYRARFTGTHTYFTNEENEAPLDFEVRIAPDGAITIAAG